jgi:hypothetical protein
MQDIQSSVALRTKHISSNRCLKSGGQMTEVSRRSFLIRSSATLAAAGAVAVIPAGAVRLADSKKQAYPELTPEESSALQSLVVHVANPATGELSVMFGTEEVRIKDHRLIAQLASAIRAPK